MSIKYHIGIGDTFGFWTVIADVKYEPGNPTVLCRCKCGTVRPVNIYKLLNGKSKSCGCAPRRFRGGKVQTGQQYGYWTVLKADVQKRKSLCRCICGTEKLVGNQSLTSGHTMSCGCRRAESQSIAQIDGVKKGRKVMQAIHNEGLTAAYINRNINRNSTTMVTGVSIARNGTYRAHIMVHRRQIHLGVYRNIDDAIKARKAAEEKYFRPLEEKVKDIKDKIRKKHP